MPSCITHELIAEEAKKRLPEALARGLDAAPDYYYLGAQGADVFFFLRPLSKKEYNLGKFLHRNRVYDLFTAFDAILRSCDGEDFVCMRAYVLGYIAHYSADAVFHPFVYRYLEKTGAYKRVHQQMENDWDVYFLREKRHREAEKYVFPFSLGKISKEGALYRLIANVSARLGRRPLSARAFKRCLKTYRAYLRAFHGRCYGRARDFGRLDKFFRVKGLSYYYPRRTPAPEFLSGEDFAALAGGRAETADGLFDLAAEDAARRILLFEQCFERRVPLPREEFDRHLLTGEHIAE